MLLVDVMVGTAFLTTRIKVACVVDTPADCLSNVLSAFNDGSSTVSITGGVVVVLPSAFPGVVTPPL